AGGASVATAEVCPPCRIVGCHDCGGPAGSADIAHSTPATPTATAGTGLPGGSAGTGPPRGSAWLDGCSGEGTALWPAGSPSWPDNGRDSTGGGRLGPAATETSGPRPSAGWAAAVAVCPSLTPGATPGSANASPAWS